MKVKFLAVNDAPGYALSGEIITTNGDSFDLSVIQEGGAFVPNEGTQAIQLRDAYRDNGELYVTLGQMPPVTKVTYIVEGKPVTLSPADEAPEVYTNKIEHRGGNWRESDWIDAASYDPGTLYIQEVV
ncbi:hypothetical protein [Marinobacter sp.]|uniref:hypothetical protein n=1 Tax=Marinobacter sp. TaxID=50741 RepID=UPI003A8F613F